MEKQKLQAAGINYEVGIKRFAGNEALFEKYLNRFRDDTHLQDAVAAYETGSYEDMLKAVHAMKGVVGTLGMEALFKVCADIVSAIRAGEYAQIGPLMPRLEQEYTEVMKIYE